MLKKSKLLIFSVFAFVLTGCLIPEKFSASIDMKPDGSYVYKYDGTAVNFMALDQIRHTGHLSARDDAELKKEVDKGKKVAGVKNFTYSGQGRYELSYEKNLRIGQEIEMMNVISVRQDKDGVITITPQTIAKGDQQSLSQMGVHVDGTVEVKLPSNAKIIYSNATGTPGFFSSAYSWKIGSFTQPAQIKFKLVS